MMKLDGDSDGRVGAGVDGGGHVDGAGTQGEPKLHGERTVLESRKDNAQT